MKDYMPTKIITGNNVIENNKNIFREFGNKCLIISSKTSAIKSGALDDLLKVFKELNVDYDIFNSIEQNPTVKSCIEAGKMANKIKADYLIGVGGGSPLDATKTASIVASNPELTEEDIYALKWTNKPIPTILIGTTAGTGAEVTKVSVMTNSKGNKKSIHHDDIFARYALGDPKYTLSMPKNIQISTAIDALAHLTESYFDNKANDISKAYSFAGIRLLYPNLILLKNDVELDMKQREDVYNASILGGLAINITGTCFPHALGYYFTENYKIPHGFACGLFTNSLLDYEYENNKEYVEVFFKTLQININDFKDTISSLMPNYNIKLSEEEINSIRVRYDGYGSVINTYGKMTIDDIEKIVRALF